MGRDTFRYTWVLKAPSNLTLNTQGLFKTSVGTYRVGSWFCTIGREVPCMAIALHVKTLTGVELE